MLYLIDNERAYEFHRLLLVETDVDARQVELLRRRAVEKAK